MRIYILNRIDIMRKRIRINDWGGTTLGSVPIKAEHEQRLTKSLLKDNRIDDLKRALDDPTFHQKLLEEYGID